jgi:hypothetical protein
MANRITTPAQQEAFIAQMTQRMADMARQLSEWAASERHTLAEMEQTTLKTLHELGNALLTGLCHLYVAPYPEQHLPCPCGGNADYQRMRSAHMTTLLGDVDLTRAYYLCQHCHHGLVPLDQQLGFCAGGISAGLDEILALMGAQFTFEEAATLIEKLTLVTVCPSSSQAATEALGQMVLQEEGQSVEAAWNTRQSEVPTPPSQVPARLYVSMDGSSIHIREEGWREIKLGAIYTTTTVVPKKRPDRLEVRAQDITFYTDIADPATFGRALWLEACRRGVTQAKEIVAVGDGAHWIWNLVDEHFPGAIQIVDWYHATEYIWNVAHAVYGEGSELAKQWAKDRLDELWEGKVDEVLRHFQAHSSAGETVQKAITYYTNNKHRMRYPEYRARGLQIGSGSIESGCKHVIAARLKQAGMIWNREGARAVAKSVF